MTYEKNGKQLHSTRFELMIALNYLLDNCPNEKKTSKTIDLERYSLENFKDGFIDRRKANEIFEDLVEFTQKYPNIIPYTVLKVNNKPRYYIKKNLFSEKDIDKISNAIKNHPTLTEQASDQLIERFLDKVTDEEKKNKIVQKLKQTPAVVQHIESDEEMRKIEEFQWLRDNQARFYFKLEKQPESNDITSFSPFFGNSMLDYRGRKIKPIYEGYYAGYVYELRQTGKSTKVIIYLPDYQSAVIANIKDVTRQTLHNPFPSEGEVAFPLKDNRMTIEDWVEAHYQGKGKRANQVLFKFYTGENNFYLNDLKPKFKAFFKKPMNYRLETRTLTREGLNGEPRTIVANDAYVEVECCFEAFKKWYWESGAFQRVVVLEPKEWNDRLLELIVDRFARRLTNYGYKCNYDLNRTYKPEYEEYMRERHERMMKWHQERMERIRSREANKQTTN